MASAAAFYVRNTDNSPRMGNVTLSKQEDNVMTETVGSVAAGGMTDQVTASTKDRESSDIRTVAVASAIGNMIEYYDFTLYATATALVFNKIFFPSFDPLVGSLAAFATFFIGYCARPLGGVLFGHLGDRIGRKTALLAT